MSDTLLPVPLFDYQENILRLWGNGFFFCFCAAVYHEPWSLSWDFRL